MADDNSGDVAAEMPDADILVPPIDNIHNIEQDLPLPAANEPPSRPIPQSDQLDTEMPEAAVRSFQNPASTLVFTPR